MEVNKVYNADCLEVLKGIPDGSVNITFADPPFNLGKKYECHNDSMQLNDYKLWCMDWMHELIRITKSSGAIFIHNIPKFLGYHMRMLSANAIFKNWIAWDAPTSFVGNGLQATHYGILYYAKSVYAHKFYKVRYPHKRCRKCDFLIKDYGGKKDQIHPFGPVVSDVWTDIHRVRHSKYRDNHPCQLPVSLLERIILMCSDEGDIIFDPFMGTGTTALAAANLGRNYLGSEISSEYCSIIDDNLKTKVEKKKIGNVWVSKNKSSILTTRDCDWEDLKGYFEIPENLKDVDFTKINLSKKGD